MNTLPDGLTIYTGSNSSRHWSRDEWVVRYGMAHPVRRHQYWSSVQGLIEDTSSEIARRIVTTSATCGTRTTYTHAVEFNGIASRSKL